MHADNGVATYLDTFAVAYAAAGRFDDAITMAQKAIELARSAGEAELVKQIEARLELYRSGRACHQPMAATGESGAIAGHQEGDEVVSQL